MPNDFYNHGSFPTTGSAATSASMRAELDSIVAGFDKMPTLTGNANEVVVVNASGTALASLPSLPAISGGTGFTSYAVGDILYAGTTTSLYKLAGVATGNALISGGVGAAPTYGKIGLTTHVTGTLPATNGGTGQASYAVGDLLFASTTTALSKLADVATGNALISGGVGVAPSYGKIGLTTHVSGTLPTANGGTNLTSFTANGVMYASSTSALATGSEFTFDGNGVAVSVNSSTNALRITQTGAGNALVVEDSTNPDSTPFVVDAGGKVGIGVTTTAYPLTIERKGEESILAVQSDTGAVFLGIRATTDTNGTVISGRKARGDLTTPTIVSSGDTVTTFEGRGHDGVGYRVAATISAAVDGTPGTNDMPGRLVFSTTADGASSPTERMRIDSSGNVGINTTSPQTGLHVASDATTGGVFRLENTLTSIASGNSWGEIEFYSNDSSTNASGVRAKIQGYANGTTGASQFRFYTTNSSSTTLVNGLTVTPTGISTNSGTFSSSATAYNLLVQNELTIGYSTTFANNINMTNTDTQIDVDLTSYFPQVIEQNSYMKVDVAGIYIANPASITYATATRLNKSWAQNIAWNGTTYLIAGAVLQYTAYNQDSVNFPAGAVNAAKVLTVVSSSQVLLRLQNRTSPAATSTTNYAYKIEILTNY